MNTQRALELADKIPNFFDCLLYAEKEEIAAILRHYAEIMQAEVVAEIDGSGRVALNQPFVVGTQLIIKPKPLEQR